MSVTQGGGIFVSYRRQDESHLAGRLYDRLVDRFGEGQVFMDVDTIEPGIDFAEEINRAVAACKVLVAVIGPNWLTATDEQGRRRLDAQDDFVRLEIEAALARGVRVIPILAQGAVMPGPQDLPESIASLAVRNALLIRHESFRYDAGRLVTAVERVLASAPGTTMVPTAPGGRSAGNVMGEVARKGSGPARNDPKPVRKDLDRAARLFALAERIANSTDKSGKAGALSSVAKALAATDPDRAERIANSITNLDDQTAALSSVAKALAATDPDRAERIANSIPDKSGRQQCWAASRRRWRPPIPTAPSASPTPSPIGPPERQQRWATPPPGGWRTSPPASSLQVLLQSPKAAALSSVAEALAATDPDRAARLFAAAESIANSITNKYDKVAALSSVAKAVAATDPDCAARLFAAAESIANSITSKYDKARELGRVAEALAATDPDRAERITNSIPDKAPGKAAALSSVAKALAATSL